MTTIRVAIATLGFLSALTGPWWIPATCMFLLSLRWRATEVVLIGLLIDFIWKNSWHITLSWHSWPLFTIYGIVLLWGFEHLRQRLMY